MFASFFQNTFRKTPGNITSDLAGDNPLSVPLTTVSHNEYNVIVGSNNEVVALGMSDHADYVTLTGVKTVLSNTMLSTTSDYVTLTGVGQQVPLSMTPTYTAPTYVETGIQLYYNPEDPSSYSGSGTSITDLSGNGFTGTISGATHSTNSFLYDGTDDFIYTPNMYSAFNSTTHFTLEVWYNPTWTNANEGGTVVSEVSDINFGAWHYALMEHERAPFGGLAYDYAGIWTSVLTPVNPYLTTNGWRQIVLSYDGTTARSYTNASGSVREVTLSRWTPWGNGGVNSYILTFGHGDITQQSGAGANYFKGNIGIVRVYNRALSGTEVLFNYDSTKSIYGL